VSDVISEVGFGQFAHVTWPRAQSTKEPGLAWPINPLHRSISLKFSLETRLESESFEPLIDLLVFLVQKL